MIRRKCFSATTPQGGFATLTVALIIVFLATFMTLYAAKVGVMEQRITANQFRAEEALAAAEAGVEQGIAYLKGNRRQINSWNWVACSGNEVELPCGDGTENVYQGDWAACSDTTHAVPPANGSDELHFLKHITAPMLFMVVAKGHSADGSGRALAKQGLYFYPFRVTTPDAPLMAAGEIGGGGNLHVVTNPNGGGMGVPLSAWANNRVTLGGSAQTCQVGEFLATDSSHTYQTDNEDNTITLCPSCTCPAADALSNNSVENIDILDKDGGEGANPDTTDFPGDLFEYIFGVPEADWQIVKDEAVVLPDCSSLNTSSSGLYWITGSCEPGSDIGSYAKPALLVVEGDITANSNLQIFALIFAFSSSPTGTARVMLNGGPTVYGALVSNRNIDLGNGTYRMRFGGTVLQNLSNDIGGRGAGLIPGSWADYYGDKTLP